MENKIQTIQGDVPIGLPTHTFFSPLFPLYFLLRIFCDSNLKNFKCSFLPPSQLLPSSIWEWGTPESPIQWGSEQERGAAGIWVSWQRWQRDCLLKIAWICRCSNDDIGKRAISDPGCLCLCQKWSAVRCFCNLRGCSGMHFSSLDVCWHKLYRGTLRGHHALDL